MGFVCCVKATRAFLFGLQALGVKLKAFLFGLVTVGVFLGFKPLWGVYIMEKLV